MAYGFKDDKSKVDLIDFFHPIGSFYETSDSDFDPNISWGGTWELEEEGLVHIGAGSNYAIGATGGEETHILTSAESGLPIHGHGFTQPKIPNHSHTFTGNLDDSSKLSGSNPSPRGAVMRRGSGATWTITNSSGGGGACTGGAVIANTDANASSAHNNMQPYVVINRWHRIA